MGEVLRKGWDERAWAATETAGLEYSVIRPNGDGGASIFLKFAKGTVGAEHTHPGGEELLVVSGDITIGGRRLQTGDYLYTPPGDSHDAVAHEETVLFLCLPKLPVFL
jgi:quercetin dioxygenase-like cupin family protein